MKSKKGWIEFYMLGLAIILGIVAFYINFFVVQKVAINYVGQYQFSIIKTANKAENYIFYIDQSAKYALEKGIDELAQHGGLSDIESNDQNEEFAQNPCKKFSNSYVWFEVTKDKDKTIKKSCFDENNVRENLKDYFNKNLNDYIANYPENLPTYNYNYEVKGNLEILGFAIGPINIKILKDDALPNSKLLDFSSARDLTPEEAEKNLVPIRNSELCDKGIDCRLNKDAETLLMKAKEIADKNHIYLIVISAYRTKEKQLYLWNSFATKYPDPIIRRSHVCDPNNPGNRCEHMTGRAVDVYFKGKDEKTNPMTKEEWKKLHEIMSQAGWVRYGNENDYRKYSGSEPWHFECCGTPRQIAAMEHHVTAWSKV